MYALLLSLSLAAPNDAPAFLVESTDDERSSGQITRLASDLTATLKTGGGAASVANVISLRRADLVTPGFPTGPQLITTAGDRIVGRLVGGDGQSLRFRPSGIALAPNDSWKVPLSSAAVLWLVDLPSNTPIDPGRYEWLADLKNQDALRFRNGDLARGTADGFDPNAAGPTLPFRPQRGELRSVAARELAAIAFNPALARVRKPKGAYARIVLVDGTRLAVANPAVSDDRLRGETLFGQKVETPLASVVALDVIGGKATYLSDLKPKGVEQSGFLGVTWPWTADRSVRGEALCVRTSQGDSTADRGLGTHPRTTLKYELGSKFRRFEALVGLDPQAPSRAQTVIRILVDGKMQDIPELAKLTNRNAIPIRVDVSGAKELVLVTDFGPAGGVGADVNWADAKLVE
jgi:NPCBM/NEW2 domain-containing protein